MIQCLEDKIRSEKPPDLFNYIRFNNVPNFMVKKSWDAVAPALWSCQWSVQLAKFHSSRMWHKAALSEIETSDWIRLLRFSSNVGIDEVNRDWNAEHHIWFTYVLTGVQPASLRCFNTLDAVRLLRIIVERWKYLELATPPTICSSTIFLLLRVWNSSWRFLPFLLESG